MPKAVANPTLKHNVPAKVKNTNHRGNKAVDVAQKLK